MSCLLDYIWNIRYDVSSFEFDSYVILFQDDRCLNRREVLIRRVKMMLNEELLVDDSLKGLEFVDELQRLGISYHFEMEINQLLEMINERFNNGEEGLERNNNKSLYAISLHFRILRQHGYHIPQGKWCTT